MMSNKKLMIFSLIIVGIFIFIAVFAPMLAPYDPNVQTGQPFESPGSQHILGTNDVGQDIFSEIIMGTRYSIIIGVVVAIITITIATVLGIIAGYFGGAIDSVIMRTADFFLTIPFFPMVILLSALMPGGLLSIIIVLSILSWPDTARVVRSSVLEIKNKDYILNIKAMGAGNLYILCRHIFRELTPILAYRFTIRVKSAILAESTLSFLGLGSPTVKSWGTILYYAQARNAFMTDAWLWWVIPPGIMISLFAFGLMLISYTMEGKIDKRREEN